MADRVSHMSTLANAARTLQSSNGRRGRIAVERSSSMRPDTYAHVMSGMQQSAVEATDCLVPKI